MYSIKKWAETFECPYESKRPKGAMTWHATPVELTSEGRLELMRLGDRGLIAYAVFMSLVAWSAGKPRESRGRLVNSDGDPMKLENLADAIRVSPKTLEKSLDLLVQIGWLNKKVPSGNKLEQKGSDVEQKGSLHNRTEQDKTEQNVAVPFDHFWQFVPRKKNKANAIKAWDKLGTTEHRKAVEAIQVWATSDDSKDSVRGSIHMATWLNQKRYDDDPSTWSAIPETPRRTAAQIYADEQQERMIRIKQAMQQTETNQPKLGTDNGTGH